MRIQHPPDLLANFITYRFQQLNTRWRNEYLKFQIDLIINTTPKTLTGKHKEVFLLGSCKFIGILFIATR